MNSVYAFDNNYDVQGFVAIKSLLDNVSKNICIYISIRRWTITINNQAIGIEKGRAGASVFHCPTGGSQRYASGYRSFGAAKLRPTAQQCVIVGVIYLPAVEHSASIFALDYVLFITITVNQISRHDQP